jgi:hypothetical protein
MAASMGTGTLDAFAPSINTDTSGTYDALYGEDALTSGLQNILSNAEQRKTQAFDMFRRINPGTPVEGNTAFANTLASIDKSTKQAQEDLVSQMNTANEEKYKQDTYNEIKSLNGLNDEAMKFYIDLAQKSDDEIAPYISSDIDTFKQVFGSLYGVAV